MFLRAMHMLPQEVILQILDFLDPEGDAAALKACSLVSSSIRAHSQRRLFHCVTLDLGYPSQQVLLHEAFTSNPVLPDSVLHLQLFLAKSPVEEICDVLRHLHNVRGVTLKLHPSDDDDDDDTSWEELLHIQIRDFLARIICLPTCQSLSLGSEIYFPLNFVSRLSNLRHLQCSETSSFSIHQDVDLPMPYLQSPENEGFLESLTIEHPLVILSLIESLRRPALLSLSRLRVCHISFMSSLDGLEDLFGSCPLLERLHIMATSPLHLNFSSLKHLRAVCIHADVFAPGAWLARILATLPISQLEFLGLSAGEPIITEEQWSKIDYLLAQEGDQSDHDVKMRPRVVWYSTNNWIQHRVSLRDKLPRLVGRGRLVLPAISFESIAWDGSSAFIPTWSRCTICFPSL
ncbi:hypothetical protein H2248_001886 [Termitomyces sp. 'cryptogamus']|nr:hypothetical protein H2248_001886 [Termitomyces sp. 'cryptogamus']